MSLASHSHCLCLGHGQPELLFLHNREHSEPKAVYVLQSSCQIKTGTRSGFFQLTFAFKVLKSPATLNLVSVSIPQAPRVEIHSS